MSKGVNRLDTVLTGVGPAPTSHVMGISGYRQWSNNHRTQACAILVVGCGADLWRSRPLPRPALDVYCNWNQHARPTASGPIQYDGL